MLKLSKKVEYGLLAMQYMASRPGRVVSSRDISSHFGISTALVAKVLQALVHAELVRSYQGVNGGYALARDPSLMSIADVILAIEGAQQGIVDCQQQSSHACDVAHSCTIQKPLSILQQRISVTFASMTVAELTEPEFVTLTLT